MVDVRFPGAFPAGHPWFRAQPPEIRDFLWELWLRTGGDTDGVEEALGAAKRRIVPVAQHEEASYPASAPVPPETAPERGSVRLVVEEARTGSVAMMETVDRPAPVAVQQVAGGNAPVAVPSALPLDDDWSGVATLSSGTATVSNVRVTANSRVMLTAQNAPPAGAVGHLYVSARSAGTSFTITSTDATDDRDVAWLLLEP